MIKHVNDIFSLETKNTGYYFTVAQSGHLEHIYYGSKVNMGTAREAVLEKCQYISGNLISYSMECDKTGLEDVCLEMSGYGKGDIREPFVSIVYKDGSFTSDFLYKSYTLKRGKADIPGMPSSYGTKEECDTLDITLIDSEYGVTLHLLYTVFEGCDVITRSAYIENTAASTIRVERLMSMQLDMDECDYDFINFSGAWAREMNMTRQPVGSVKLINSSYTGTSSNRNNPFVMLAKKNTTEDFGECFGFNLVYSGNHYECAEVNAFGKLRYVSGINPANFNYMLKPGEKLYTPEAVMTYSDEGFNNMSHHMHDFVRNHIVRGEWKDKERPVLLNSWEAVYFDFDESKLLRMVSKAKEAGIELFVLDDGWFGKRDNDKCSLGDWYVNKKKLPGGLKRLADRVNSEGLSFGLWIEPEMVNEDSDLYRAHPDYAVKNPGRSHSTGRNQMILDLTRSDVRDYVVESITAVLGSANISYVKWDMNRIFSDAFSSALAPENQGEFLHRYVLGFYDIAKRITESYPHILFEGCASGGNRFDLGMLCYFPQIWASDNTDAVSRCMIQTGYSYGYPMSVVSAHVSGCPNHQTLRNTPLDTRFNVAMFGVLGYECNFSDLKKEEFEQVKKQVEFYKKYRKTLMSGDYYRIENGTTNAWSKGVYKWMTVSKTKKCAMAFFMHEQAVANSPYGKFATRGLDDNKTYHFYNIKKKYNVKEFGDLINTVAPFHVKKDSLVHNVIAKVVKLDGEFEDYMVGGSVLNHVGIRLKQAYQGVGYDENVRYFGDCASRIYIIEEDNN